MHTPITRRQWWGLLAPLVAVLGSLASSGSFAQSAATDQVEELKFREIYRLPVGPKGFELSERTLKLDGRAVRVTGYMVSRETVAPGQLILAPLPVAIGDEDESYADDLPASVVFVHLAPSLEAHSVQNLRGLLQLTGTLHVGRRDEPDGRVANAWLQLDEAQSRALLDSKPVAAR